MPVAYVGKKAYDGADVTVTILGALESECKSVSYSTEQEHQVNHSLGADATSYSIGKKTHKASIELAMASVTALERLAPSRDLIKLKPFNITVTYVNDDNVIVTDVLNVKFQSTGREVNGLALMQKFELLCLAIKYQA